MLQITRSHVLTSAHCISPFLQVVRLGEYDLSSRNDILNPLDFAIEKTMVHEEYVPDIILNDIGIVKLRRRAPVNGECKVYTENISSFTHQTHSTLIDLCNCQYSDRIRPICLPIYEPLRSSSLTGYAPFVAGWGSTNFQGPQSSVLQDTQVQVVSTAECERSYKSKFAVQVFDDRIICAGSGGHDACQGDSGLVSLIYSFQMKVL